MAPVTEMADPVGEAQPEQPSPAGKEISRAARQKRLELNARDCKSKLPKDINTVTQMLNVYHEDFPEDDINCEIQLGEANAILRVIERAGNRWEAVEKTLDDLKSCIFQSLTLKDIDAQIEKVDAAMVEYEGNFTKMKKEKRDILKRCTEIVAKAKKAANRANTITNNQTNSNTSNNTFKTPIFKPQPELKPIFLAKDCLLLEFNTFGKNFVSYMNSSPSPLPEGSVDQNIRVNLDPSWYVEL